MNTSTPSPQPIPWFAIVAGLCASLVAIGLARFAYTPLIPPLIDAHWFSAADVVYLGAANLAGYLAGALLGRPLARHIPDRQALRLMMVLTSAAFLACAFPLSVSWFFAWRFLSGVAGGVIMVLVAACVLPHVPVARRGMASGAIFLGAGLGIAASGTVIPLLLQFGLRETWIGLGVLSAVLTAVSWFGWPLGVPKPAAVQDRKAEPPVGQREAFALKVIYVQYALMAIGLVPMMVFLVDYVARGLGWGPHVGSVYWVLYGVGAIVGPMVYGLLVDRLGAGTTLRMVLLSQAVATALIAWSDNAIVLGIASVLIGTFPSSIPPLVLGRFHQVLPNSPGAQHGAWTRATTIFALFQALAGYAYSYVFASSGGDHQLLFLIGAVAIGLSFLIDLGMAAVTNRSRHAHA